MEGTSEPMKPTIRVLLVGSPNVGKTTLINRLNSSKVRSEDCKYRVDANKGPYSTGLTNVVFEASSNDPKLSKRTFKEALSNADVVLHLIDAGKPGMRIEHVDPVVQAGKPMYLVRTKSSTTVKGRRAVKADFNVDSVTGCGIDRLESFLSTLPNTVIRRK